MTLMETPKNAKTHPIGGLAAGPAIVVGGGPAGMIAALALAKAHVETVLVTPAPPPAGTGTQARTAALFAPSLALLEHVGVLGACRAGSAPLTAIRIIDNRDAMLRAPEVLFTAHEIGLETFGLNVPNADLVAALRAALAEQPDRLTWIDGQTVTAVMPDDAEVRVVLADGRTLTGALVVAADGRQSVCRAGAGIGARAHTYDQVAMTAILTHQRPHDGVSTELHGSAGPCTTVPLPGNASSLVWIERPVIAERLMRLDTADYIRALEGRLQGLLGAITSLVGQGRFALSWMQAERFAARRVMLIGEAAHVMPPIGAQGLNLGLRDVGHMVDCVTTAVAEGRDPGGTGVLDAYHTSRAADIGMRMTAVDALNRSLLSDLMPVHLARGAGLHAVAMIAPLRRAVIGRGMRADGALPSMMRAAGVANGL